MNEDILKKLELVVELMEKSQNTETQEILKSVTEMKDAIAKMNGLSEDDKAKIAKFEEMENQIKKMGEELDKVMKGGNVNPDNSDEFVKFEKDLNAYFKTGEMSEIITKAFNTTVGGVLIPSPRANEIIKETMETSPVLRMAKRYSISDGNSLMIPVKKAGTRNTAAQAEGTAAGSASEVQYDKLELKVGKITDWVNITSEMIDDSDFNVLNEVMETLRENIAHYLSDKVWNGTIGSNNEIEGIYNNTTVTGAALETGGAMTWEHLKNMIYHMPPKMRATSYFIVSTAALSEMRGFKDKNDRPLYIEPLTAGEPGTFMGYKVYEDTYMQDMTDNNYPVFFGNMSKFYAWLDKKGMYMERARHEKEDTWDYILRTRLGGKVRQASYGVLLKKTAGG